MGEPHSYKMPNEAKQAAVKKFREFEDHLLRYDKEAHVLLSEVISQIQGVNADSAQLGEQSDWYHASSRQPMRWSCPVGWGIVLTVEMWKA
jgi:hypothetical protein